MGFIDFFIFAKIKIYYTLSNDLYQDFLTLLLLTKGKINLLLNLVNVKIPR